MRITRRFFLKLFATLPLFGLLSNVKVESAAPPVTDLQAGFGDGLCFPGYFPASTQGGAERAKPSHVTVMNFGASNIINRFLGGLNGTRK